MESLPGGQSTSFYGYDAHGNIGFLTDATGAVTDTYEYDAWGNLVGSTGSTPNTRVFAGAELDLDLGLVNLRARYYNPSTGRFLTIDPLDAVTPALPADLADGTNEGQNVDSPYIRAVVELFGMGHPPRQRVKRYLYAGGDPSNLSDPSGLVEGVEEGISVEGISGALIKDVVITTAKGAVIGGGLAVLATVAVGSLTCFEALYECLERKGYHQVNPDCSACCRECVHAGGVWPRISAPNDQCRRSSRGEMARPAQAGREACDDGQGRRGDLGDRYVSNGWVGGRSKNRGPRSESRSSRRGREPPGGVGGLRHCVAPARDHLRALFD